MVEFILPGSTTAFKNCRYVNVMGLAYILAPLSRKRKTQVLEDGIHLAGAGGDDRAFLLTVICKHHDAGHRAQVIFSISVGRLVA